MRRPAQSDRLKHAPSSAGVGPKAPIETNLNADALLLKVSNPAVCAANR